MGEGAGAFGWAVCEGAGAYASRTILRLGDKRRVPNNVHFPAGI